MWKYEELVKVRELVGLLCRITRGGARGKNGWEYKGYIRIHALFDECQRAAQNLVANRVKGKNEHVLPVDEVKKSFAAIIHCIPTDILELIVELRTYKHKDEKKLPWGARSEFNTKQMEVVENEIAERILLRG